MNAEQLRAAQAPLKEQYRDDPRSALKTLKARGDLDADTITCRVESHTGTIESGLHPATGGDGSAACSGEILLQTLVACAGVTLKAVATAMGLTVRGGTVSAEADWDVRGTLGVDRAAPVGLSAIRLRFALDTDATEEQCAKLLELTERYCVIDQTLRHPPGLSAEMVRQRDEPSTAAP